MKRSFAASMCRTLAVGVLLLLIGACSTLHEHPETGDRWEAPSRFDRDREAEVGETIFALYDGAREISAVVHRIEPAYPSTLLPALVAHRIRRGDSFHDFEPRQAPPGWTARWADQQRWTLAYTFSGAASSYVLLVEGPESADELDELFERLVDGLMPADPPTHQTSRPPLNLDDGLNAAESLTLEPVDAQGAPRRATLRAIEFPTLMAFGHLMVEPLPYSVTADEYMALVLERSSQAEVLDKEPACPECAGATWTTEEPAGAPVAHTLAVIVRDEEAYQIRLHTPAHADLDDDKKRWLEAFFEDPAQYFDDVASGESSQ